LKAIFGDSAHLRRQEIDDEPCGVFNGGMPAVFHHAIPHLGRDRVQALVHQLVVTPSNLRRHPSLKLRHSHRRFRLAGVLATLRRVGHRGAGLAMDPAHQRARRWTAITGPLGTVELAPGKMSAADVIALCQRLAAIGVQHAIFNQPNVHEIRPLEVFGRDIIPAVADL
jgi:hypothetical protein